jgi:L-asparaginase
MGIVVVATGGTISMRPDPLTGGLVPALSGEDLLELIRWPEAPPLELDEFAHVPSWDMHGELAFRLALRVREQARRPGVTGVVVTHGTDTMEESVWMIDRLLDSDTPVVLVGAQRANSVPDSDGPRNLRNGILVAAAPAARGRGALICFDGEIHAAREVQKVHTSALRAFGSPGAGPVGLVDELTVRFHRAPERRPPLPVPTALVEQVDLIRGYAGWDGRLIRASLASGARALVLEATGRGNGNGAVLEAVREAVAAGVPVVLCSRCAEGRVEPAYARGGGFDLAAAGAILAGDLPGPKARVLLQLALGAGLDAAAAIAAEA